MYESFKADVIGKIIGDGQCVALVVNTSNSYTEYLFPGVNWTTIISPVPSAKDLLGAANSKYYTAIANNHDDPNQVPEQGDIMVFDATPAEGYANTYNNPDGHCGICDSASASGYSLLQQNSPNIGSAVNVTSYAWKYRPCLGWLHPVNSSAPAPSQPAPATKTIYLPPTTGPWHVYNVDGPYSPAQAKGIIVPSLYGGLTYPIVEELANGVVVINTQDYGQGALWTAGSDVIIK